MSKQQIEQVFDKVLESGGKKAVSRAMREVGYPETTAKNPQKITKSKTWKGLMAIYLPDKLLAKKHKEGLNAVKKQFKNNNKTGKIEEVGEEVDYATRHKYLETAYKIKKKIPKDGGTIFPVQINFGDLRDRYK